MPSVPPYEHSRDGRSIRRSVWRRAGVGAAILSVALGSAALAASAVSADSHARHRHHKHARIGSAHFHARHRHHNHARSGLARKASAVSARSHARHWHHNHARSGSARTASAVSARSHARHRHAKHARSCSTLTAFAVSAHSHARHRHHRHARSCSALTAFAVSAHARHWHHKHARSGLKMRTADTAIAAPPIVPSPFLGWNADLSTGNWSQWAAPQACSGNTGPPKGTNLGTSPTDPTPPGYAHSIKFVVADNSIGQNCPGIQNTSPSAQLLGPWMFKPGMNTYIGFSLYTPTDTNLCHPYVSGCFFSWWEVYGPPYYGPGPVAITTNIYPNAFVLGIYRDPNAWTGPSFASTQGKWQNFVIHINWATDNSGYVELYFNGVLQQLHYPYPTSTPTVTRIYEPTLISGVNWNGSTGDHIAAQQYRSHAVSMGTVTTYESGERVGSTLASVSGI
jgi:hypothetical protein